MSSFSNKQKSNSAQISAQELAAMAGTSGTPGAEVLYYQHDLS